MNNFESRYKKLNEKQKKAVDTIDGPVLVVAGPGSGKTELLSLRTARILTETQVSPSNILLLTFTESGAHNMRERIISLIGETGYRVAIYTFHAFASDVIGHYGEYFFEGAAFRPATDIERINIVENILESLPRDNPLTSRHTELGYTYLYDILAVISALKKGDLSGEEWKNKIKQNEKEAIEINERVGELFLEVAGKRKYDLLRDVYLKIYAELDNLVKENDNTIARYLLNTLSLEIKEAEAVEKASNLTKWKDEYFTKNEDGIFILKDSREEKIKKWLAVGDVYEKYNLKMYEEGLYDFDDMIFRVSRELENNESLRAELEERYQYIMIDEFQDTSDSQFSLIKNLTKSPVNEGRPNVLAVGDDDQAIFKFQGAELDNITKFIDSYRDVELITLDKNYRSTQNILDHARRVIMKAEDRLELRYGKVINKNIEANNRELLDKTEGEIVERGFANIHSEFDYVAREIKNLLSKKVDPREISVISRSHANLKSFANICNEYSIPYSYEKEENVFDKAPIREIITLVEFAESGMNNLREDLLPEILSYKFWDIDRIDIWRIAEKVREGSTEDGELGEKVWKRVSWLSTMLASDNQKIKSVAEFLAELIVDAESMPLLHLIDKIIGTHEWEKDNDIDEEEFAPPSGVGGTMTLSSPFKEYYFGKENFDNKKLEYLEFLFALRTFIGALREWRGGEILFAKDLAEFVSIYENNDNLSLSTISPFATSENAIILQTAHKSKGLEYEYVFIINSDEDEWNGRKRVNKIGMPINLPLLPASDNLDDRVRLYYVAMTRAKHTLYITHNKDKFSVLLAEDNKKDESEKEDVINNNLINSLYIKEKSPILDDERVLLKRLLENYKMPVTHLINYLNIGKVGPDRFIEQNLLRFPQAMSPSSVYGSAMHEAMQNYYLYKNKYDKAPDIDRVAKYFKNALSRGSLTELDFNKYYESGIKNLEIYLRDLENRDETGRVSVEVNFNNEGVHIGEVYATGKIDKMLINGDNVDVTDLKTGKSFRDWDDGDSNYDKIKLHFFRYQLAYYALLMRNSRTYNKYKLGSSYIEFLEADNKNKINILELVVDEELMNRVEALANVVYKKIINLDFPDTSHYKINGKTGEEKSEISLKDIEKFEEDLLSGNI